MNDKTSQTMSCFRSVGPSGGEAEECLPLQKESAVLDPLTSSNFWLAAPAVARLLVFFRGSSDPGAAQLFGIILAKQHIPLLTAFQNFLFLRGDAPAHFVLDLFFLAQYVGHRLY